MSCLLPLVAGLCLFDPANLVVRADLSWQVSGRFDYYERGRDFGSGHLARLAIQVDVPMPARFTLSYGVEHSSLWDTNADRGQERAFAAITWRPFRAQP